MIPINLLLLYLFFPLVSSKTSFNFIDFLTTSLPLDTEGWVEITYDSDHTIWAQISQHTANLPEDVLKTTNTSTNGAAVVLVWGIVSVLMCLVLL